MMIKRFFKMSATFLSAAPEDLVDPDILWLFKMNFYEMMLADGILKTAKHGMAGDRNPDMDATNK
jgi:hypothetical protein